jgi:pimeloyl-ACP methyl ester carboxylesterase
MRMRPLWPATNPAAFSDWRVLADDLERFLDQQGLQQIIGVGHSVGATTTLRLALRQPERFQALVLIDPVIFPPAVILAWNVVFRLGLAYRLHPLVKSAMRRRTCFENQSAMFANYRKKAVFSRMSDKSLRAYVDALACPDQDGQIQLCYPADWEARIYVTGIRADLELWRQLAGLVPPVLFIRGSETDTFLAKTARMIQKRLKTARISTIPDSTHLVALEKPDQVFNETIQFLSEGNYLWNNQPITLQN